MKITEIDLAFVKQYLRVEQIEDDQLIGMMITSSQSYIQNYLNKKFTDFTEVPDEFTVAALALISHWYEKREIMSDKDTRTELGYIFSGLLDLHRNWNSEVVTI